MTAISGNPVPLAPEALSSGNGTPAAGGASTSFADTLLALLDRAIVETPGAPDNRFASGTMRSSVEMFGEHGLFDDRAATDPGPSLASETAAAPGAAQPPVAALPVLRSDPAAPLDLPPVSLPATTPLGMLASDPRLGGAIAVAGSGTIGSDASATVAGSPRTMVPLASLPGARVGGAVAEGSASPEGPAPTALRRDPAALAASRVKVSLDHHDAGVAVSVVADLDPDADTGAIHDAVSHLLARHGLVLSDLRVTRRPGAGGQDRKD